jgi:hypothetical protein
MEEQITFARWCLSVTRSRKHNQAKKFKRPSKKGKLA